MMVWLVVLVSLALAAPVLGQSYINGHLTVEGGANACNATGASNAYACTLPYAIKGYKNLQCFRMKANHTNTGPATINIHSYGAKAIRKWSSGSLVDLAAGDLTAGQFAEMCYDGTVMQLAAGTGDTGGGSGGGDITAVGNIATGAAGTTAAPLSQLWWSKAAAPATPAADTGVLYFDTTSENVAAKNDLGTVTHMLQTRTVVANEFVTGVAPTGAVSGRRPILADLLDNTTVVTTTGAQTVEEKFIPPRVMPLGATFGNVTPDANTSDVAYRYDVTGALSFQTPTATGGNPRPGQMLRIVLKSATPQPLTWSSAYSGEFGTPLPTTTRGDGVTYDAFTFWWNSTTARWTLLQTTATNTATGGDKPVDVYTNPAGVTPASETYGEVAITALAQALTLNVPTWTTPPRNGQYLAFHLFGAAAQTLTWDTGTNGYSAESGIALPRATTPGVRMMLVFRWNPATAKWGLVGSSVPTEPVPVTPVTLVCDDTTNNTPTLQAAINAGITSNDGSSLMLVRNGTGLCRLNSTVSISNVAKMFIDANDLTFVWGGNTTTPMFLFSDARDTLFTKFHVETGPSFPLAVVFQYENGTGTTITPTNNVLSQGTIDCINTNGCTTGVLYALGAGGDANNDLNTIANVQINNPTAECIKIAHSQSKGNVFDTVTCGGNTLTGNFVETTAGSFVCRNCGGGNTSGPLFLLGNATDAVTIDAGNFEGGTRLLETGGPSGAQFPVTIRNSRWTNHELHVDNRAILFQFPGPLLLEGNTFEQDVQNRATEFYFNPGGGVGAFVSLGNYVASTRANPYTGVQPDVSFGNLINRNDGSNVVKLPAIGGGSGGGTGTLHLPVGAVVQPVTNAARLDGSENNRRLLFDAATQQCAWWVFRLNTDYASTPVLRIPYSMTSATSGTVAFDVSLMATAAGASADIQTDSYATANNCDDAAVPGTAGFFKDITCSLSQTDGMAAGHQIRLRICRDVATDTATGDAEILNDVVLEYAR